MFVFEPNHYTRKQQYKQVVQEQIPVTFVSYCYIGSVFCM